MPYVCATREPGQLVALREHVCNTPARDSGLYKPSRQPEGKSERGWWGADGEEARLTEHDHLPQGDARLREAGIVRDLPLQPAASQRAGRQRRGGRGDEAGSSSTESRAWVRATDVPTAVKTYASVKLKTMSSRV